MVRSAKLCSSRDKAMMSPLQKRYSGTYTFNWRRVRSQAPRARRGLNRFGESWPEMRPKPGTGAKNHPGGLVGRTPGPGVPSGDDAPVGLLAPAGCGCRCSGGGTRAFAPDWRRESFFPPASLQQWKLKINTTRRVIGDRLVRG